MSEIPFIEYFNFQNSPASGQTLGIREFKVKNIFGTTVA